MVRKHMPVLVMVAVMVAAVMSGIAAAQPTQTEIRLGRQATLVGDTGTEQIIVEFTYRCSGTSGTVIGQASQTTPARSVTGFGSTTVRCDDQLHRDGVTVITSAFPGWQTGPAMASVALFSSSGTDSDSGDIRIVTP